MAHIPTEEPGQEPPRLRQLRLLVTLLTITLIFGMITITGLLAWRLTSLPDGPTLPAEIPLPEGERLISYTQSPDYTVLITRDTTGQDRLHLVKGTTISQSLELN